MGSKNKHHEQSIDFTTGSRILKDIHRICDQTERLATQLESDGYSVFRIAQAYERSYCASASEQDIHDKYLIEKSKELISSAAISLPSAEGEQRILFESPFIAKLRIKRDHQNGISEDRLYEIYPELDERSFRIEIDPAKRAIMRQRWLDYPAFVARQEERDAARWNQIEREASRHEQTSSSSDDWSWEGRLEFAISVISSQSDKTGFYYSDRNSSKLSPAFSRSIFGDWEFILCFETTESWAFSPFLQKRNRISNPTFKLDLYLCDKLSNFKKRTASIRGKSLKIDYDNIIYGMNFYRKFYSHSELFLVISANLQMLSLVIDEIEYFAKTRLALR